MNAETGTWTETPQFGHFEHENVVPVEKIKGFMVASPEDSFRVGVPSYLFAYIADSFADAVSGDPAHGSLYVWRALDPTDTGFTIATVDDMANPDNLGTSPQSLMIEEDRENPFRVQYSRILRYDLSDGSLTPVARVNTLVGLPGQCEASGIIWAGNLLGGGWWLTDVQAHTLVAPQPGPTLAPNTAVGEDGQLDALFVPGS